MAVKVHGNVNLSSRALLDLPEDIARHMEVTSNVNAGNGELVRVRSKLDDEVEKLRSSYDFLSTTSVEELKALLPLLKDVRSPDSLEGKSPLWERWLHGGAASATIVQFLNQLAQYC